MTQDWATPNSEAARMPYQRALASSYYTLLGVHPSASVREIRQAYRDLSKLYHPDTTSLPAAIATTQFQQLNEAYATLSSPERRTAYDRKIGYSRIPISQPLPNLSQSAAQPRSYSSSSAYLDPTDRPLSPGEVFALFILGLTFVACLVLAITIGFTRGEAIFKPTTVQSAPEIQQVIVPETIAPETTVPQEPMEAAAADAVETTQSEPLLLPPSTPEEAPRPDAPTASDQSNESVTDSSLPNPLHDTSLR